METNIFKEVKEVKELSDLKQVVKDILGKPAKEGTDNKYHSPFVDGDNDPSFIVSNDCISDFSSNSNFGTGKDIFNFLVAYNDVTHFISEDSITNFQALKWLVKKYNLDVNVSGYVSEGFKLPRPFVETKLSYSLKASDIKPIYIHTMFDTQQFKKKPTGEEMGLIKNRISQLDACSLTYDLVKKFIINGQTCIPAGIKSEKDWVDGVCLQQIFMLDIDNTAIENGEKVHYHQGDSKHITIEKIQSYCEEKHLLPTFIYHTLSHTDEQHRFRLVYILDYPIDNKEDIKNIYHLLVDTFKDFNVDTAPTSVASLFLGGKDIAYESGQFYKVEKEEKKIVNNEALKKYNDILKYSPYAINNRKLCTKKSSKSKDDNNLKEPKEDFSYTEISNFIAYVDKKVTYKNGTDINTFYHVNCVILDNPYVTLEPQIVDEANYIKGTYLMGAAWNKYAIVRANRGNIDKIREVTQIFSKHTMKEEVVYSHMGFRKIKDDLCYLYHGGVIGNQTNVSVDLSKDSLENYTFTSKNFKTTEEEATEIHKAIKLSYSILDLADYKITVPLIAVTYLSPLYSLLKEQGILADFITYMQGASGTRKSSLAAVLLNHFGKFNRDTFPCCFRDTLNTIEKKAYILKDCLNVIDDYNPEVLGNRKLDTVEKLFGMYGDRTARGRMSQDGSSLKKSYTARGLAIITGETIPEVAHSRIARSIIINLKPDSINLAKLSYIQDNLELLSLAMRKFIELIISNEQKLKETIKTKYNELNNSSNIAKHGRTNEIANILKLGFYIFTEFLASYSIISENEQHNISLNADYAIDELVKQQSDEVEKLEPTQMFFNAFEELIATHSIYVDTINPFRVQQMPFPDSNYRSELVGFYNKDKDCYYLYPQKIYTSIVDYYSKENIKFPISEKSLWRYLLEEGFLYRTDKTRYTVQRDIYGKKRTVVEITLPKERS